MGRKRKKQAKEKATGKSIMGSIGLENALTMSAERARYDKNAKGILKHVEVLSNILKYAYPLYEDYSANQIARWIDKESIDDSEPIAPDTDTRIREDNTESTSANEARVTFDSRFRIKLPSNTIFHVHVDVELQGNYYPGYPLEKRGIYNLARMVSSQLEVINKNSNYGKLQKVCVIFICVGNVPKYLWNTASYYQFANVKNIGEVKIKPKNYDLMDLIMVRLGPDITENSEHIFRLLHGIFFGKLDEVGEYIDFSKNETFRKEVVGLGLTGAHFYQKAEYEFEEKVKKYKANEEKYKANEEKYKKNEKKHMETEAELRNEIAKLREEMGK